VNKKLNIFIASIIFAAILWGSISLSDSYYTDIEVKLTPTNFPKGYTTGSLLPDKIKLRVRGQGWRLVSINVGPETEFRVSVGGDSGRQNINLYNFLESNRWLLSDVDIINLYPDSLNFFVERIISKKLPVVSGIDLKFKPGYGLASEIILNPDSVIVKGPLSYLKSRKEIETSTIPLGILDSKTSTEVNLDRIMGFEYNSNLIDVVLDVQRIVDEQYENISVEVIDTPSGSEVVLLPNKININIRGGIEILGKLMPEQFHAYVKYQTLIQDTTGSVVPEIILPKNVTLQFSKPDRLRYVIRSF
jgi:hypothetical protein